MSSPESYRNGRAELQKVFLDWLMETSLILSSHFYELQRALRPALKEAS